MKKEIKKKTTKKVTKKTKTQEKQIEPAAAVSFGSLIVCINDFNSEFFIERIFVIIGILLIIVGTWKLHIQTKKENKKINLFYLGTCILFTIALLLLVIGIFII